METQEENRTLPELLRQMEQQELYRKCRIIVGEYFSSYGQQGVDFASNYWNKDSRKAIVQELSRWFSL